VIRNGLLVVALVLGVAFIIEFGYLIANPPPQLEDAPRHGWTIAWFAWMLISLSAFVGIEGAALINDEAGDTLTEHIQWISGKSSLWAGAVFVGIASFFLWFLSHLFGRDSRVWIYLKDKRAEAEAEAEDAELAEAADAP
jgi:hypothetical protein